MAFGFGIGKNKVLVYSVDEFSTQVNTVVDPKLALKQNQHGHTTGTLLSSGWTATTGGYAQTINVTGVTSGNTVIVSAAPAFFDEYGSSGIYATAQGAGTVTFFAKYLPANNLTVNFVVLGV